MPKHEGDRDVLSFGVVMTGYMADLRCVGGGESWRPGRCSRAVGSAERVMVFQNEGSRSLNERIENGKMRQID
jgi:hypothetical protein